MNFIDKLERKFPRFGIPNLMKYVICLNIVGVVIGLIDMSGFFPISIYQDFLCLDFYQILHGQIWRLVTFILYPTTYLSYGSGGFVNLLWFAVWTFLYYQIGISLERNWGTFRFNLFYLSGVVFVILTTFVFFIVDCAISGASIYGANTSAARYLGTFIGVNASLDDLNETLFLAYAFMFPDVRFLIYFLIPVKAKWLAYVYLVLMGFTLITDIIGGYFYGVALIVGALINFAVFFIFGRGMPSVKGKIHQERRRRDFRKKARPKELHPGGSRHRCAICGRTEADNPSLEFRFCSKCNGNYEYCSDHLFSHEHVR